MLPAWGSFLVAHWDRVAVEHKDRELVGKVG